MCGRILARFSFLSILRVYLFYGNENPNSLQVRKKVQASRQLLVGVQLNQDDVSEFFSFEQPSYNYYEFISDIGGALGLILGLSIQVSNFVLFSAYLVLVLVFNNKQSRQKS